VEPREPFITWGPRSPHTDGKFLVGIETGIRAATLGTRVTRSVQLWRLWGPSVFDPLLLLKAWLSFFFVGHCGNLRLCFAKPSSWIWGERNRRRGGDGWNGGGAITRDGGWKGKIPHDTRRVAIWTCAEKLTYLFQLKLPHETKKWKKLNSKKWMCSEVTVTVRGIRGVSSEERGRYQLPPQLRSLPTFQWLLSLWYITCCGLFV